MVKVIALAVAVLGALTLVVLLSFLSAWFVMLMVNYLFSAALLTFVFGSATIGFGQAFFLTILTGWLFKTSVTSSK